MGRLGLSNALIRDKTPALSDGQINYRLRVLKDSEGIDQSIRNRWKNGDDPMMWEILEERRALMLAELRQRIVPKLKHPTPETVKV